MIFLIVHDRKSVADAIVNVIVECGFSSEDVDVTTDVSSTRRAMQQKRYDLLVVDLTLPNISGMDSPSYAVVDHFLQELFHLEDMLVPGDIIGLTMDPEALDRIQTSIGTHVMALLGEDSAGKWKQHLSDKIKYVAKSAASRQYSIASQYDYDVLLVTALDKELAPYKELLELAPFNQFTGAYTFGFGDKNGRFRKGAAFSIGKSGEARAASYTQSLLANFRPKLALMTGICGGIRAKTALGDVIIADSAIDWDYGKWEEPKDRDEKKLDGPPVFVSRPDPLTIVDTASHRIARDLVQSDILARPDFLRKLKQQSNGLIEGSSWHLAPMASGSSVIASEEISNRVHGLNDSIRGVDMECFGFYHAAIKTHVIKPSALCIKAVSDHSNGSKGDAYHAGCTFLSAYLGVHLITEEWNFDDH